MTLKYGTPRTPPIVLPRQHVLANRSKLYYVSIAAVAPGEATVVDLAATAACSTGTGASMGAGHFLLVRFLSIWLNAAHDITRTARTESQSAIHSHRQ